MDVPGGNPIGGFVLIGLAGLAVWRRQVVAMVR
jgi:MYXO-CTERM domain-containing protein